MKTLKLYTDGACSGNPGPGGFAGIIIEESGREIVVSGGEKATTNNRMELRSFIDSLEFIQENYDTNEIRIDLHVDSQYLMKGCNEWLSGWKKKNWKSTTGPVKNKDLWEKIDLLLPKFKLNWTWVKGHDGDKYNEMADEEARKQIEQLR
jgi:ribonuclease HI